MEDRTGSLKARPSFPTEKVFNRKAEAKEEVISGRWVVMKTGINISVYTSSEGLTLYHQHSETLLPSQRIQKAEVT